MNADVIVIIEVARRSILQRGVLLTGLIVTQKRSLKKGLRAQDLQ